MRLSPLRVSLFGYFDSFKTDSNAAYVRMKELLKKAGLPSIRFHDLRHSCATLLYDSGIDMKAIQEWLGHSNISTTMNIYAHLNYKNKVISANAIAGIIPNYKEKEPRTAAN